MGWASLLLNEIEVKKQRRPILTVIQINQEPLAHEEAQAAFLVKFSKMTARELEALPKTKTEYDIGYAPKNLEDIFDGLLRGVVSPVTLQSGNEVRVVPLRGGSSRCAFQDF